MEVAPASFAAAGVEVKARVAAAVEAEGKAAAAVEKAVVLKAEVAAAIAQATEASAAQCLVRAGAAAGYTDARGDLPARRRPGPRGLQGATHQTCPPVGVRRARRRRLPPLPSSRARALRRWSMCRQFWYTSSRQCIRRRPAVCCRRRRSMRRGRGHPVACVHRQAASPRNTWKVAAGWAAAKMQGVAEIPMALAATATEVAAEIPLALAAMVREAAAAKAATSRGSHFRCTYAGPFSACCCALPQLSSGRTRPDRPPSADTCSRNRRCTSPPQPAHRRSSQ